MNSASIEDSERTPLKDRDRNVRLFVYEHFARSGSSPSLDDIASANACSIEDVEASLARLGVEHHALALAPTTQNIWMAHPFSAVPTAFRVDTADITYWGNCAWDAVAIPSLLGLDASVPARSAESGETIVLTFRSGALDRRDGPDRPDRPDRGDDRDDGNGVVHFVVPPRRFWDNVGYT